MLVTIKHNMQKAPENPGLFALYEIDNGLNQLVRIPFLAAEAP
jgi:hypothetical protein